MESGPFSSKPIKEEAKKFVMVRMMAEKEEARFKSAGIASVPTLVVLDPDGKELWKETGFLDTDPLKKAMDESLAKLDPQQGK